MRMKTSDEDFVFFTANMRHGSAAPTRAVRFDMMRGRTRLLTSVNSDSGERRDGRFERLADLL